MNFSNGRVHNDTTRWRGGGKGELETISSMINFLRTTSKQHVYSTKK
jgi:hypothetical protein